MRNVKKTTEFILGISWLYLWHVFAETFINCEQTKHAPEKGKRTALCLDQSLSTAILHYCHGAYCSEIRGVTTTNQSIL